MLVLWQSSAKILPDKGSEGDEVVSWTSTDRIGSMREAGQLKQGGDLGGKLIGKVTDELAAVVCRC